MIILTKLTVAKNIPLPSLSGMASQNPQTSQETFPSFFLQPPEGSKTPEHTQKLKYIFHMFRQENGILSGQMVQLNANTSVVPFFKQKVLYKNRLKNLRK